LKFVGKLVRPDCRARRLVGPVPWPPGILGGGNLAHEKKVGGSKPPAATITFVQFDSVGQSLLAGLLGSAIAVNVGTSGRSVCWFENPRHRV
jgi:hypothetical protein